ncbi:glycosyltransferase 87 family protein [Streptomyces sp. NPDC002886]|uniref:glycosyltransferase 87 family protein n=1 Tax=Streptomyces sp. NPDC002886 TaxID=3364667 RepID=UPI003688C0E6
MTSTSTTIDSALRGRAGRLAMAGFWLATRTLMVVLLVVNLHGTSSVRAEITVTYNNWYNVLVTGTMPHGDVMWQYPPAAAAIFLSPDLLPFLSYFEAFVALTVICDALITVGLVRAARRSDGSLAGAVLWLTTLPLLLSLPFARYDLQVTLLAVGSLLCLRFRRKLGGVLAGIGAMVKVWPLLTLIGTPRGRTTRDAILSAVAAGAVLLAVLALFFRDTLGFLGNQGNRGIQVESLGGSALMFGKLVGAWSGKSEVRYGAYEYVGPYVSSVAMLSVGLTVVGFAWLLLWRIKARRWTTATPLDAGLCAILVFTITSRVLSPQYLMWLVGLAAVCLTCKHTTQRPVAWLIVAATAVTTVIYPLTYVSQILAGSGVGTFLLVLRNGLLAWAAVWSCLLLWRASVSPVPETGHGTGNGTGNGNANAGTAAAPASKAGSELPARV